MDTPASRAAVFPLRVPHPTAWRLARLGGPADAPGDADWIPASVPGAVQLDWARARGLPDLAYAGNVAAYAGLEDFHWMYRTEVPEVKLRKGEELFFYCGGVDFQCEVRLGGVAVLRHTGMLTAFELDVSAARGGTPLEILVYPAPKREGMPDDRTQASDVTKPAVSYGWDWHPRLIPLGLCEHAGFEVRARSHIRHADFAYRLAEDLSAAEITVSVECSDPGAPCHWRLLDPEGLTAVESRQPEARLDRPRLWWTHDQGAQALYTLEVALSEGDFLRRKVGFRRIRLVMHPGAWESGADTFPKSREKPPITLELNGRRIFAKGSNWVCPDIFHGRVGRETYQPLLELARGAHFNLLRCWGGAPAAKEAFFERCDELGILVWQEFPLACNLYPDDPAYLRMLDQESRSLIRRVRQHPCLGMWVGGNELFNSWSKMTDQGLPLRLLDRNCFDLDRGTPFLPTAPVEGMGHGDYRFRYRGREVFETFRQARCTAYTEFGCPGASPVDYIKTFIPEAELWPPRLKTSWEVHHGLGAWEPEPTAWLCTSTLRHYFGPAACLEDLVAQSAWLQCEGCRFIFEEARRQQPRCSMALNWCFNEPWPTAANNSIVNWPARPKPAYTSVKEACRPVLASARIPRFQWRAGDLFTAELWILNDTAAVQPAGVLRAELVAAGSRHRLETWAFPEIPAQENLAGPAVRIVLPDCPEGHFTLELLIDSQEAWSNSYRLSQRAPGLPSADVATP